MASGPITSWEIDGETVETVSDFIFLGSKSLQMVTAAMKLSTRFQQIWKQTCSQSQKQTKTAEHIHTPLKGIIVLHSLGGFQMGLEVLIRRHAPPLLFCQDYVVGS